MPYSLIDINFIPLGCSCDSVLININTHFTGQPVFQKYFNFEATLFSKTYKLESVFSKKKFYKVQTCVFIGVFVKIILYDIVTVL